MLVQNASISRGLITEACTQTFFEVWLVCTCVRGIVWGAVGPEGLNSANKILETFEQQNKI